MGVGSWLVPSCTKRRVRGLAGGCVWVAWFEQQQRGHGTVRIDGAHACEMATVPTLGYQRTPTTEMMSSQRTLRAWGTRAMMMRAARARVRFFTLSRPFKKK